MPQEPSTTSLLLLWYLACCVPFFIKKLFQSRKATQRRYEGQTSYAQSQVHDKNTVFGSGLTPVPSPLNPPFNRIWPDFHLRGGRRDTEYSPVRVFPDPNGSGLTRTAGTAVQARPDLDLFEGLTAPV